MNQKYRLVILKIKTLDVENVVDMKNIHMKKYIIYLKIKIVFYCQTNIKMFLIN
jgi:hypothetical protein